MRKENNEINFDIVEEQFENIRKLYIEKKYFTNMNYLIRQKIKLEDKLKEKKIKHNLYVIETSFLMILPMFLNRMLDCLLKNDIEGLISLIISIIILLFIFVKFMKMDKKDKIDKTQRAIYELELDLVNKYISDQTTIKEMKQ